MNYYNEFNPQAAQWLKNLIAAGQLPPAIVDSRPIQEVTPDDLRGFTQCHFFACIGGWSKALEIAGWRADRPVWTGSCPCQPLSVAGRGLGTEDERHLWPEFRRLVADCNPSVVFGEQVASKDGRNWLSGVRSDLEAMGYGVGAADLCAAGVKEEGTILLVGCDGYRREPVNLGPAHIRQRLYWVADCADGNGRCGERGTQTGTRPDGERRGRPAKYCFDSRLGQPDSAVRSQGCGTASTARHGDSVEPTGIRVGGLEHATLSEGARFGLGESQHLPGPADWGLGDSLYQGLPERVSLTGVRPETGCPHAGQEFAIPSAWRGQLIPCGDGKARRIEPGLMPLVDGLPGRVASIRGYGNAIVPTLAAEFISAYMECDI